jgi:hypothetical protein
VAASVQARELLARSELEALRSKLNPHFLFNMLHGIVTLVRKDAVRADRVLLMFSDLLRYVPDTEKAGSDAVPLPGTLVISADERLLLVGEAVDGAQALKYDQHAVTAFGLHAVDYLLKPFSRERFGSAIAVRGSQCYVRVPLAELEPRLPTARFLRVHRNAIVNLDFVVSMKPDEQSQLERLMKDGSTLLANRDASKARRDAAR